MSASLRCNSAQIVTESARLGPRPLSVRAGAMDEDELMVSGSFPSRVPLTRGAEIAHLLGRIEATLEDLRHDVQASTKAQETTNTELRLIDRRVIDLEGKEEARKRYSRIFGVVALGLLIPMFTSLQQVHDWFLAVNNTCFPKKR